VSVAQPNPKHILAYPDAMPEPIKIARSPEATLVAPALKAEISIESSPLALPSVIPTTKPPVEVVCALKEYAPLYNDLLEPLAQKQEWSPQSCNHSKA